MRSVLAFPAWLLLAASLGGCGALPEWFGDSEEPPLPGKRVAVLALDRELAPDPRLSATEIRLPRPRRNLDWPQPGGSANRAMHHLALGDNPKTLWTADIGSSSNSTEKLVASPVVAQGKVFTMDAQAKVSAFEAASGRRVWRVDMTPESEDSGAIGGGLAADRGKLFVTTAYGEILALDTATGATLWRRRVGVPFRGAPAADGNRVLAITVDNQLHALNADTGRVEWNHAGITEQTLLLAAASPAVDGGTVIAPYSSGELYAIRLDSGAVAWSDQLVRTGRMSSIGVINDIAGQPVIDRGRVYAVSHSGRLAAVDMRTGERVWDRELASIQTPWVAGDFIYVVTLDANVVCLTRADGRVRWVHQLQRYRNPDSKTNKGIVNWYGPVLAGDRLVLVSSEREAVSISPYTGEVIGQIKLSRAATVPPVVADDVLYILTDDATLTALK
jgi:outer membrane protein assembly factor BamB